ncbi:hypothetical protein L208DRAFT_1333747, partial [Tricholoma matsutake]
IFLKVHSFGLPAWHPDLLGGTHTSLYNGAVEPIAIWTFEQAAITFAYQHLAPNLAYLQNRPILEKLYCNFIWGYMKKLAGKEAKEKGSRNPDGGFFIMRKKACNPHVTEFLHHIDNSCKAGSPLFHGSRKHEEPRILHPENLESQISTRVPVDCPLDWFDPAFFNAMLLRNCALFAMAPVVLPLKSDCHPTDTDPDWKNMPQHAFMKKYGNSVRALYNIPTTAEMEALELEDGDNDDEDDEDDEEDDQNEQEGQGEQEQMED